MAHRTMSTTHAMQMLAKQIFLTVFQLSNSSFFFFLMAARQTFSYTFLGRIHHRPPLNCLAYWLVSQPLPLLTRLPPPRLCPQIGWQPAYVDFCKPNTCLNFWLSFSFTFVCNFCPTGQGGGIGVGGKGVKAYNFSMPYFLGFA